MSHIIAKKSKPFTDGEYVKQYIMEAAKILSPENEQTFKNISLSANMVAERVNNMTGDTKCQLKEMCKTLMASSTATDEGTDIAQLLVFIRRAKEDFQFMVGLLEPVHI
jgi:hypothetical protein